MFHPSETTSPRDAEIMLPPAWIFTFDGLVSCEIYAYAVGEEKLSAYVIYWSRAASTVILSVIPADFRYDAGT
jgi:hypothetical protein